MSYPPPPYGTPQPAFPPPMPPRRKTNPYTVIGIVIAAVFGVCGLVAVVGLVAGSPEQSAAPAATQQAVKRPVDPTTTAPAEPIVEAEPEPVVTTKPTTFAKLSEREWKKIAKDPDAHVGKAIVVFGSVTQFDTATGTSSFRADVGAANKEYAFDYPTNTLLNGDPDALSEVVEDDEFRANVIVTGSFSYETTLGGEMTVPQLEVQSIKTL